MEALDTGPRPTILTTKFKNTRTLAWLVFSVAAMLQIGLFAWVALDALHTQRELSKFELGESASCPPSGSQTAVIIKMLLALAALIGTGIGLVVLSQNPFDIKRVMNS